MCELRVRAGGVGVGRVDPCARAGPRARRDARSARGGRRALSAPALGSSPRRSGSRASTTGCPRPPPFELRPRTAEPEIVRGPRIGISKAVDRPWRYGLAGLPLSQPRPTTRLTTMPGPAASPATGACATIRPALPSVNPAMSTFSCTLRRRAPRGRQARQLRDHAVRQAQHDQRHRVVRRKSATSRLLRDHAVDALQRLRRLVGEHRLERLRSQPDPGQVDPLADDARHLDLVRLAVRGALRPVAAEVDDRRRAPGTGRCRAEGGRPCGSRASSCRRGRAGVERLGLLAAQPQRRLCERLPDQGGKDPPATGSP